MGQAETPGIPGGCTTGLCLRAGCRGRGQPGIPVGWQHQSSSSARLWEREQTSGVQVLQWRDLEMQRDGCCELGEGMREAVPSSSGCSERQVLGKTGPELSQADSRITQGACKCQTWLNLRLP